MASDWLRLAWTQTWQVTALVVAVALLVRLAAANRPQLAYCAVAGGFCEVHHAAAVEQPERGVLLAANAAKLRRGSSHRSGGRQRLPGGRHVMPSSPLCFPPRDRGWRGRGRRVEGSKGKHRILAGS